MLKKRLIFTLLFSDGHFMLSRNFKLQKVGDLNWLNENYNFSKISFFIDELIILDVSRNFKDFDPFRCSIGANPERSGTKIIILEKFHGF